MALAGEDGDPAVLQRAMDGQRRMLQALRGTFALEKEHGHRKPGKVRGLARKHRGTSVPETLVLLESRWHEDRMLALILWGDMVRRSGPADQDSLARLYLRNKRWVDEWDLVDTSAPYVLGPYVARHGDAALVKLARSQRIWDRRIAMVTTQHLIRAGQLDSTFKVAGLLLEDSEDLIHKAVGWMLREAGARDPARLRKFLQANAGRMPRTMLRYAIEHFSKAEQARWRSR